MTESCWLSINLIKMILRNKGFISIKLDYIEKNRFPSNQPLHIADFSRYEFISFFHEITFTTSYYALIKIKSPLSVIMMLREKSILT